VLVLRPKAQGARTARALARLGHEAVLAPLLEITPIEEARLPSPRSGKPYAAVIAASPHVFTLLDPENRARLAALPAMLVGARTARAAEKAGLCALRPLYRSAGELAAALRDRAPQGRLLYLTGRDRRPEIEHALRREKRSFDIVEIYAATILPALPLDAAAALRRREIDAVLHYSARSAKAYVTVAKAQRLLARALAPLQLCLSEAVADPLIAAGAKRVELAGAPNEACLLGLLPSPLHTSRKPG
jgi:uroporphyrinogen-III synthase